MDLSNYKFPKVTEVDLAFPTFNTTKELVEEAERRNPKKGMKKFSELFYSGGKVELQKDVEETFKNFQKLKLMPRVGFDPTTLAL